MFKFKLYFTFILHILLVKNIKNYSVPADITQIPNSIPFFKNNLNPNKAWIGSGGNAKKVKINQDSIGDFFEAKGFNCKWFSPHYSVQSRKNAKFKIRNLEIFCDADFTNQKWCVQKGTLQCVNMRKCGGTKESCRCSDERCKYLKSLVKDAQC